ncbi:Predicted ATP-dependent endonuclease of the OLD family, contains P-loop ATPase and TOPRIM domains [Polaribacter sp. KT25b]|uniref:ATP-dependent nuclease n=1 Tax=Polaribacter sp. KT25b TaxID=1855336 RepID=UPI00087A14C0|nr:AAA family ATPase [Polaribacter sp. KT25b]SDR74755.1 Predicted ATP-dependent endonuclease of the OLD family, contains P-loop ATPase and TOPRIM domains [Polaribacter sp. KT25b]
MKIKKIEVTNFRLLEKIICTLEDDITLIVGKNNTGKTSFFEAIKLATSTDGKFIFEDFSQSTYAVFKSSFNKYLESKKEGITEENQEELEKQLLAEIPKIKINFEIEYNKDNNESLVELSEFITDLEDSRNDATICISFEPKNTLKVFHSFENREDKSIDIIKYLQQNIKFLYDTVCYAIDKESDYKRKIEDSFKTKIQKVMLFENIKAMRILDDINGDSNNALSLGFSNYYKQRDKTSNQDVKDLEDKLKTVSGELKIKYEKVLESIMSKLGRFGAKTRISIPTITIDSKFDSEKVIKNNIQYLYLQNEVNLPESYNGLGYSNLIYMILELESFIEKFKNSKEEKFSNFLVILIEEPEAHMHPQMQQVFISQVSEVLKDAKNDTGIQIQVIITTHSSHILSESGIETELGFNRIRYFNRLETESGGYKITNQDFNNLKIKDDKRTFRFLRQYLTLHKSDLFFADKVILVEGTTERMLLPQMIKKSAESLCNEYVSILEVGGAYAHSFREMLEFINVRTLIITDIDSSNKKDGKCPVEQGEYTKNYTLIRWLPQKELISELTSCKTEYKIQENIRVAYQTKENGFNARSFEDAFINTNKEFFLTGHPIEKEKNIKDEFAYLRNKNIDLSKKIPDKFSSKQKTEFTFDIMSFNEKEYGEWKVPEYINEGLIWLAKKD